LSTRQKAIQLLKKADPNDPVYSSSVKYLAYSVLLIGTREIYEEGLKHINAAIKFDTQFNDIGELADDLTIHAQLHLALFEIDDDPNHLDQAFESSYNATQLPQKDPEACHLDEYCYTHVRVLQALGRLDEVEPHLRKAFDRVMQVAEKTQDEELRQTWLENVAIHREIMAEAKARGWIEG
jgi:tetratricopeptide (TPR) repeat protein